METDEPAEPKDESSSTEHSSTLSEEALTGAVELPSVVEPATDATDNGSTDDAVEPQPPLEIYVERSTAVVSEQPSDSSSSTNSASNSNKNFIITNEDDPKCTNKIQVFTVPVSSTSSTDKNGGDPAPANVGGGGSGSGSAEEDERIEIVKNSSFFSTSDPTVGEGLQPATNTDNVDDVSGD